MHDRDELRDLIRAELKASPQTENDALAQRLGCKATAVASIRALLESAGEIPPLQGIPRNKPEPIPPPTARDRLQIGLLAASVVCLIPLAGYLIFRGFSSARHDPVFMVLLGAFLVLLLIAGGRWRNRD
jgi:hypothetical protein